MTVSSENRRNRAVGDGIVSVFPYTFEITSASEIIVEIADPDDNAQTLVYQTDYTLSGIGDASGGNVTLTAGPLTDQWSITSRIDPPVLQLTEFDNQGAFLAEKHEDSYDYITRVALALKELFDRTVTGSSTAAIIDYELPGPEANKLIGYNSVPDALQLYEAVSVLPSGSQRQVLQRGSSVWEAVDKDFLSVKDTDFGATGDGTTDDTAAIQAALDAAQTKQKAVFIPGGEYTYTQLVWPRGVRIFGEGCMGTLETNDKYSQTVLVQRDGNENSGIILRPEGSQGADLYMSDLLLIGPSAITTGTYHGIEFIDEVGADVSVQGQVFFERMFIRRWKGSGIKTSDTGALATFSAMNVTSRTNGRYGFEFGYHPDALRLRNINTEKNRLAGVYLGEIASNMECSIDGWYIETAYDDQGFGDHPSFAYVSPYALELNGASTATSNSIVRVSNVSVKADTVNNRVADAVIFNNTDGALYPVNVEWSNIVVHSRPTGTIAGNGSIMYDNVNSIRVDEDISSGYYFQDGTYGGVDFSDKKKVLTSDSHALVVDRTGSSGLCINLTDDTVDTGGVGIAGEDPIFVNDPDDIGVRLFSTSLLPTDKVGTANDNAIDLGIVTGRYRVGYIKEFRVGDGTIKWLTGSGSPETVVTAPVGSLYTRTDGGASTTLYIKESGTGNTGWVAK